MVKKRRLLGGIKIGVLCLGLLLCIEKEVQAAEQKNKVKTTTQKHYQVLPAKKAKVKKVREIDKITDFSAVFDAQYYLQRYEDVRNVIGNDEKKLLEHFKEFGMKEARVGAPGFDVKAYMLNNLDLVAQMKADDLSEYFVHYIKTGQAEGRTATYQPGQQLPEGILGTFTTYYDPAEMRAINVELASSRINGAILTPGDSFSFSKSVGTRTEENGYVQGPSIAGGKEVSSIGGGICQVSSNLYVTMLLAGIEPTEQHYHGLPVDYVPKYLDAAIAENYLDLRFKNNLQHDIIIESVANNGVLTVTLRRG